MIVKFEMPDVIEMASPTGSFKIEMARLKEPKVLAYLMEYGLKQQRDVYSGLTSEKSNPGKTSNTRKAEAQVALEQRFNTLYEGNIPRGGGGRRAQWGDLYREFGAVIKATGVEGVDWKAVNAALTTCATDWDRLKILGKVGLSVAVRKVGRKATKEQGFKVVATAFKKAQAVIDARGNLDDLL